MTAADILNLRTGIFAHRGNSGRFPENTLPAFRSAFEIGCPMVETDAHLTADGRIVLWHDEYTGRNTEKNIRIEDSTLEDLRCLDAGYSHNEASGFPFRNRGLYIMTLEELLEEFPDGVFNIDLKSRNTEIADRYAEILAQHRAWKRIITGSFNGPVLKRFRRNAPECITSMTPMEVRTAVVFNRPPLSLTAPGLSRLLKGRLFQVPEFHGNLRVVDKRLVQSWGKAGIPVQVWTVNDPDKAKELFRLGVRGIFTDYPEPVMESLKGFDPDKVEL